MDTTAISNSNGEKGFKQRKTWKERPGKPWSIWDNISKLAYWTWVLLQAVICAFAYEYAVANPLAGFGLVSHDQIHLLLALESCTWWGMAFCPGPLSVVKSLVVLAIIGWIWHITKLVLETITIALVTSLVYITTTTIGIIRYFWTHVNPFTVSDRWKSYMEARALLKWQAALKPAAPELPTKFIKTTEEIVKKDGSYATVRSAVVGGQKMFFDIPGSASSTRVSEGVDFIQRILEGIVPNSLILDCLLKPFLFFCFNEIGTPIGGGFRYGNLGVTALHLFTDGLYSIGREWSKSVPIETTNKKRVQKWKGLDVALLKITAAQWSVSGISNKGSFLGPASEGQATAHGFTTENSRQKVKKSYGEIIGRLEHHPGQYKITASSQPGWCGFPHTQTQGQREVIVGIHLASEKTVSQGVTTIVNVGVDLSLLWRASWLADEDTERIVGFSKNYNYESRHWMEKLRMHQYLAEVDEEDRRIEDWIRMRNDDEDEKAYIWMSGGKYYSTRDPQECDDSDFEENEGFDQRFEDRMDAYMGFGKFRVNQGLPSLKGKEEQGTTQRQLESGRGAPVPRGPDGMDLTFRLAPGPVAPGPVAPGPVAPVPSFSTQDTVAPPPPARVESLGANATDEQRAAAALVALQRRERSPPLIDGHQYVVFSTEGLEDDVIERAQKAIEARAMDEGALKKDHSVAIAALRSAFVMKVETGVVTTEDTETYQRQVRELDDQLTVKIANIDKLKAQKKQDVLMAKAKHIEENFIRQMASLGLDVTVTTTVRESDAGPAFASAAVKTGTPSQPPGTSSAPATGGPSNEEEVRSKEPSKSAAPMSQDVAAMLTAEVSELKKLLLSLSSASGATRPQGSGPSEKHSPSKSAEPAVSSREQESNQKGGAKSKGSKDASEIKSLNRTLADELSAEALQSRIETYESQLADDLTAGATAKVRDMLTCARSALKRKQNPQGKSSKKQKQPSKASEKEEESIASGASK